MWIFKVYLSISTTISQKLFVNDNSYQRDQNEIGKIYNIIKYSIFHIESFNERHCIDIFFLT